MQQQILDLITAKFGSDFSQLLDLSPIPRGQSGDLAVKFFRLAKDQKKSPVEIAQMVQTELDATDLITKSEIIGPYLNLFFAAPALYAKVMEAPLTSNTYNGQTVLVEYSSPNTNKPLHLGHMRNHALGISVANLYESCGAHTVRTCIINDRGVHICKSMLAYQIWGNGETPTSTGEKSDSFVGRYYVKFSEEVKKDESLNQKAQEMLLKWENGDEEIKKLWRTMNDWTLDGHDVTYKRQGVEFVKKYYESNTYELGKKFAYEGLEKGTFFKEDGAVWIDLTDEGLDKKIIVRSDGTSVYVTQDLATTYIRYDDYKFDKHIWIVADEQNYHFQVLISCLDKLGLAPKEKLYHLGYGLVNLPDGRMKSREGTVVDADNLMNDLKRLAVAEINQRNKELTETEIDDISEKIQDGAWKFFLLSTSPRKSITFDKEKSIRFEGATGPYLQYAGVRIKAIFRKAGYDIDNDASLSTVSFMPTDKVGQHLGEAEKLLGNKILQFTDTIDRAAENYNPTLLVTFLLEMAQDWSSYYAQNSVLNAETEDLKKARLALAYKVFQVLETGLAILGIKIPSKM
jgi:arginyl-tRNA synthetase